MAFVTTGFGVTVSFTDAGANQVTRDYECDSTVVDIAGAVTATGEILPDIIALGDAAIPKYRIYMEVTNDAFALPASTVQIENTASLTLLLADLGSEKGNLNFPAPKIGAFVSSVGPQQNIINTGTAIVTDFTNNFTSAGKFSLSDGEKAAGLLNGKRVHKKSSRG
jgi:hypothetical protein